MKYLLLSLILGSFHFGVSIGFDSSHGVNSSFYFLRRSGSSSDVIETAQDESTPRKLRSADPIYFRIKSGPGSPLGELNPDVAVGNPLKGLMESPRYNHPPYTDSIPSSMEFYYIGLEEIMMDNPAIVGDKMAFNWETLDSLLEDSANRNMHVVFRIIMHFPGRKLKLPKYLIKAGVELVPYGSKGELSPYYGDPLLLEAMEQLIKALGRRYDGDKRIFCIQAGLLGFWGEWHTHYWNEWNAPLDDLIPESVKDQVVQWYDDAFDLTLIQVRQGRDSAYNAGFGMHDDSFTYYTLDGEANGGRYIAWYFWPRMVEEGFDDFWKVGVMGGETRPHKQQDVFEDDYPAGTFEHQDFMECVNTTHATFMFHHGAFKGGGLTGRELQNARFAHARMGYNFQVIDVAVAENGQDMLEVYVTVKQVGVAPFYYPLRLSFHCPDLAWPKVYGGVDTIISPGDTRVFKFRDVPATTSCLRKIELSLKSQYLYKERPIKWAQGVDGRLVFALPLPQEKDLPQATQAPVDEPSAAPVEAIDTSGKILQYFNLLDTSASPPREVGQFSNRERVQIPATTKTLSIEAYTTGLVASVLFTWSDDTGSKWNSESSAPWAMQGNAGDFWSAVPYLSYPGKKIVQITASNAGEVVDTVTVTFYLVHENFEPPTDVPTRMLTISPTDSPTYLPTMTPSQYPSPGKEKGGGITIVGFTLMRIEDFGRPVDAIYDYAILDLAKYGNKLSIRADTTGQVTMVTFNWVDSDQEKWQNEMAAPYAMAGNVGRVWNAVDYLSYPGSKHVEVTAYHDNTVLDFVSLNFNVVNSELFHAIEHVGNDLQSTSRSFDLIKFTLMDCSKGKSFAIGLLKHGDTVLQVQVGKLLSIRAETKNLSSVEFVVFTWNGESHTEMIPPWAMAGNVNHTYKPVNYLLTKGLKTVTATAYLAGGKKVASTIEFEII